MKTEEQIKREKLFKKLRKKIAKTCIEQDLLKDGDRVLIGLSGGKDSYILMEILAYLKKTLPFHIELFAVHIAVTNVGFRINKNYLTELCKSFEIPLHISEIAPDFESTDKNPCFLCSWNRRKTIFNMTRDLNCNKLAFGHHRDDALETLLMNMLYHGSISSLPYSLRMFEGRVRLIRPLLDLWEKDLEEYSLLKGYLKEEKSCPHEDETKRKYTRRILDALEKDYPSSKMNIFRAMDNIYGEYLPGRARKT